MERLKILLSKLDDSDYKIIQQLYAILYRYLERGEGSKPFPLYSLYHLLRS